MGTGQYISSSLEYHSKMCKGQGVHVANVHKTDNIKQEEQKHQMTQVPVEGNTEIIVASHK